MHGPSPAGTVGAWRLLRGGVVGATATTLAVGGHGLADGQPPSWPVVTAATVAIGAASVALSRLQWTLPRLLALLLVSQAGLHLLFLVQAPPPHAGHGHAGHVPEPTATLLLDDLEMLTGHVAAALATALLLRQGERWLCGVLEALGLRAVRLLGAALTVCVVRPQPVPVPVTDTPRSCMPEDAWWQRGPPR
ncbi:MAG TPA: hypothetical protein VNP20_09615 [Nocardioidaceae bacterium]|nr:hypothetical protein [Nocardioidaceae bacterium]